MPIPVVTIIGRSGSGKTRLMELLIPELSCRGYRVATIKHHSHSGFEVDQAGKDSWRHARAGSVHVIIVAPDKIASYRSLSRELALNEVVSEVRDANLILVEGYKQAGFPSLEVVRSETGLGLSCSLENRFAVVTDTALEIDVPWFFHDDISRIADMIEDLFLRSLEENNLSLP